MHGLMNRALERFLRESYGEPVWVDIALAADVSADGFDAMRLYPDQVSEALIAAASARLGKPREALLEDVGIHLVSLEPLRRLLRFGGMAFSDFIDTIEELPGRAQLAVPDLDLPRLILVPHRDERFTVSCHSPFRGMGHVLTGLLRAMADDYGTLAMIDFGWSTGDGETVKIVLLDTRFTEGREFALTRTMAGAT